MWPYVRMLCTFYLPSQTNTNPDTNSEDSAVHTLHNIAEGVCAPVRVGLMSMLQGYRGKRAELRIPFYQKQVKNNGHLLSTYHMQHICGGQSNSTQSFAWKEITISLAVAK